MAISLPIASSSREDRPILPPLHTLALPTLPSTRSQTRLPGISHLHATHDSNSARHSRPHLGSSFPIQRQFSISSSTSSRTPSPSPSEMSSSSSSSSESVSSSSFPHTPCTPFTPGKIATSSTGRSKMRLIPTTLEDADAVVVVPPQSFYEESDPLSAADVDSTGKRKSKALLLLGPALRHLRHPQRQLAKGARIHPYKIERAPQAQVVKARVEPAKSDGYFAYAHSHVHPSRTYNSGRRTSTSSTATDLSAEECVAEDVRMLSI